MKNRRFTMTVLLCILSLLFCALLSVAYGSKAVSFRSYLAVFFILPQTPLMLPWSRHGFPGLFLEFWPALLLAVSGSVMQAVTRNPIADPEYSGSKYRRLSFVVCGIAFFHISSGNQYIWLAFAGASITAVLVYGLASAGHEGATPVKLALAGAAASTALQSLVNTVMLPNTQVMNQFRFWQTGSISGAAGSDMRLLLPIF